MLYSRRSSEVYICVTVKGDAIHVYINYNIVAVQK